MFAFPHDVLKDHMGDIIQHTIPLKECTSPLRRKLRQKLVPVVHKELQKLYEERIIALTRNSTWPSDSYAIQG
jgi:hypothetical protein